MEALSTVRERLPELRNVILLGEAAAPETLTWQEFLDKASPADQPLLSKRAQEITESDIFTVQYTSGTTGAPKGAMLSHSAYVMNTDAIAERQGFTPDDAVCIPLPFFHAYGCLVVLSTLTAGATLVVLERFRAPDMLQAMEEFRVTEVSGTPTMFVAALAELSNRTYDLAAMRGGNMAGAVCPPEQVRAVVEQMGVRELCILYGSTEVLGSIMNAPSASPRQQAETVGAIMPGYEAKITDSRTGADILEAGVQGELYIRGAGLMTRYYKMEEATAKTIDAEGWLHTGDLAIADAEGFYRITGRLKDMIIRGGFNIYPAEVESFLLSHPKVLDAQVVGIPCEYYGEDVVGFLRLKQGATADVLEMKRYCREKIAINKVPFMFFFVDEYPLTASGKVQKFKLRELAVQKMAEARCFSAKV